MRTWCNWIAILVCTMCHRASPLCAQEPSSNPYAGLSAAAAQAKFETIASQQRTSQRTAVRSLAVELDQLSKSGDLDSSSLRTLRRMQELCGQATSFSFTLEQLLIDRQQLAARDKARFDQLVEPLMLLWSDYQQSRQDYQQPAGQALAKRWRTLSLAEKRCLVNDYLSLSNQTSTAVLRSSPVSLKELIPSSINPPINQYLVRKAELLADAQTQLHPFTRETLRIANKLANQEHLSLQQQETAKGIADALVQPYGQLLRGIPLCVPADDCPQELKQSVHALLDAYLIQLQRIGPAHEKLASALEVRLESGHTKRLEERKFVDQLNIDTYLAKITNLIDPVRILACRFQRTTYWEDALLMSLRKQGDRLQYQVRFLNDERQMWLDVAQIQTRPVAQPRMLQSEPTPVGGPGDAVADDTDLSAGQLLAHSPAGWKPAILVDESGLGVIIHWQGAGEPIDFYVQRRQLRIISPGR